MWAWIFHKLTGWILVGYLFTHIAVLSTATGVDPGSSAVAEGTDACTATLSGLEGLLLVCFLEVGLLAVAVFHILNEIRLLPVDWVSVSRIKTGASTRRWW